MNQGIAMTIYRYWLWIGIPLIAIAGFGLWAAITGVISVSKRARLFSVPLAPLQEVSFDGAGPVALSLEGPRFTTRFAGVGFELYGLDRQRVPSRASLMRKRTAGVKTITMELLTFDVPQPGRYQLVITGLDTPSPWDPAHAVVFMRPHTAQTVAYIVGIVLSACVLIASLVFVILRLNKVGLAE